ATFELPFPQRQAVAQVKVASDLGQGFAFYQLRTQTAQLAFPGTRKAVEKGFRDDHVEQGVTEKFQPLIVGGTATTVSEGQIQQAFIAKAVAQFLNKTFAVLINHLAACNIQKVDDCRTGF